MNADEVPQELIDIVDRAAGKQHPRTDPVVACLAEVITEYSRLRGVKAVEARWANRTPQERSDYARKIARARWDKEKRLPE